MAAGLLSLLSWHPWGMAPVPRCWKYLLLVGTCTPSEGKAPVGSSASFLINANTPEMEAWLQLLAKKPVGPGYPKGVRGQYPQAGAWSQAFSLTQTQLLSTVVSSN